MFGFGAARFPSSGVADGEDTGLTTQHVRYYSRMQSDTSENNLGDPQYTESSFTQQPDNQWKQH